MAHHAYGLVLRIVVEVAGYDDGGMGRGGENGVNNGVDGLCHQQSALLGCLFAVGAAGSMEGEYMQCVFVACSAAYIQHVTSGATVVVGVYADGIVCEYLEG